MTLQGEWSSRFAPVATTLADMLRGASTGAALAVYHHGELVVDAWGGARNPAGDRLAEPLGLDGCYVGLPTSQLARRARLESPELRYVVPARRALRILALVLRAATWNRVKLDELGAALLIPPSGPFSWDSDAFAQATVPSSNGVFTARSLARIYAVWAGHGSLDGVRYLSEDTVRRALVIQSTAPDRVMMLHNDWRLGFHALRLGRRRVPGAFGHSGYRGTGAFACPEQQLAFAFVHNAADGSNPMGGGRLARLAAGILDCV